DRNNMTPAQALMQSWDTRKEAFLKLAELGGDLGGREGNSTIMADKRGWLDEAIIIQRKPGSTMRTTKEILLSSPNAFAGDLGAITLADGNNQTPRSENVLARYPARDGAQANVEAEDGVRRLYIDATHSATMGNVNIAALPGQSRAVFVLSPQEL